MFGLKIVKEEEYNNLVGKYRTLLNDYKTTLESTKELTQQISGQTEDCKMGPWCKGCKHRKYVYTQSKWAIKGINCGYFTSKRDDDNRCKMEYCSKHIHELCPEWEESVGVEE